MKKTIFLFAFFISSILYSQPFECNGDFFLALDNNGPSVFFRIKIDPDNNQVLFIPLPAGSAGLTINAIGYRVTDNYIYGVEAGTSNLCRVDATGTATVITSLDNLNLNFAYHAGDISPDGQYLYLLGKGGNPYASRELVRIHLDNYSVVSYTISDADNMEIICSDFSIDPTDGSIYGFDDKDNRLIKFDPSIGTIDESLYPISNVADAIGATFFDAFGNLYGYGRRQNSNIPDTFFKIDKNTGIITIESFGPATDGKDGCACPYTVKLQKNIYPEIAHPCSEVTYTFKISNASLGVQTGVDFLDVMPDELTIIEIVQNPFGGNIVSGIGSNILSIENITIPQGIDSIMVKVEVAAGAEGVYKNQALLKKLPLELGGETFSDNPNTLTVGDSTVLEIVPLFVNIENEETGICTGDTLELVADSNSFANYQWSNGSTDSSTMVFAEGWYWVEVTIGCEPVVDSIYVFEWNLNLELGPDLEIELGDSMLLQPVFDDNLEFQWVDPLGNSLSCLACPEPYASPLFDVTYSLTGLNELGCSKKDSIKIRIIKERKIYFPNIFSPNFDGVNDIFFIQGKGFGFIKTFKIFNRWGAVVFEVNNEFINEINSGWDGKFKGKDLDSGVFVYVAEIQFLDGVVLTYEGDVTLLR